MLTNCIGSIVIPKRAVVILLPGGSVDSMKNRLMEIILEKSFQYAEEPIFKL